MFCVFPILFLLLHGISFTAAMCPIGQVQSAQGGGCVEVHYEGQYLVLVSILKISFSHPNSVSTHLTVDTLHTLHICQYLQRRGHFYSVVRAFSVGEAMLRSGLLTNTSRYSKHSQSHLVVN